MDSVTGDPFDVPDSTDWLGTPLAGLMQVEQAFRCHVCKDFYNSPMITSCNHTFCSICIRRCLSVDGKCPLCRALDQESKLRGNWALREAVDAFVKSRDVLLRFAKNASDAATPRSPKRKMTEMAEPSEEQRDNKRPRMPTRSSKAKAAEVTAALMREEADVSEGEDSTYCEPEPDDGLVACPICWKRMKPWQVDKHIDTSCPGSPQPQEASSSSTANNRSGNSFGSARTLLQNPPTPTKAPERLPALAYSMLKDSALRKKLAELGLSTSGSRQMLEKRHQEWVTIWNANCDSARPKKRSELLHDLEVWERTMGTRAPTMSKAANMGAQIKDKDFDGAAWASKHSNSFKELIARARSST
ncbi:0767dc3f-4b41-4cad-9f86-f026bbcaf26a [Thermothielavioides terrestris]|uniref:Postreplication repair E3 ubiquitin-protein ligase RAD18 n=1 Tax=Thermothielavioides terrestris TaxID=2587410 RepID=A0A3S4BNR0_9PEZI|nr:0767dc3f-4b41-4cad-9f86-f026bbcaf26a [Thermothielavioides terrestris]